MKTYFALRVIATVLTTIGQFSILVGVLALVGLFLFAKPSEIGIAGILIYGSGIISGVVFVAAGEVARALIDIARYCASLPLIENNTSRMVELFELTANRGGEVPRAESPPL